MPIHEYQCQKCGEISEVFLRSGEKEPKMCETCDGRLKRIISHSGFQFKGTGWYVTDYARKGKKDPAATESPAASSDTSTKTETKSDAKSDAKPSTESKSSDNKK